MLEEKVSSLGGRVPAAEFQRWIIRMIMQKKQDEI